jgi:hypothetical protein
VMACNNGLESPYAIEIVFEHQYQLDWRAHKLCVSIG